MIITEIHRGKWEIKTDNLSHPFIFHVGESSGLSSVSMGETTFTVDMQSYDYGLVTLADIFKQMALLALPYDESNFEHLSLYRAIEQTLKTLGIQVHLQEYGDEEEDFRTFKSKVCFSNGRFNHCASTDDLQYVATLEKYHHRYGAVLTVVVSNSKGEIQTRTEHHIRSPRGEFVKPIDGAEVLKKIRRGETL